MVVVIVAAVILFVASSVEVSLQSRYGISLFAIACGIVIVGCIQTTILRYRRATAWLAANSVSAIKD
jgi:hypothetical protein